MLVWGAFLLPATNGFRSPKRLIHQQNIGLSFSSLWLLIEKNDVNSLQTSFGLSLSKNIGLLGSCHSPKGGWEIGMKAPPPQLRKECDELSTFWPSASRIVGSCDKGRTDHTQPFQAPSGGVYGLLRAQLGKSVFGMGAKLLLFIFSKEFWCLGQVFWNLFPIFETYQRSFHRNKTIHLYVPQPSPTHPKLLMPSTTYHHHRKPTQTNPKPNQSSNIHPLYKAPDKKPSPDLSIVISTIFAGVAVPGSARGLPKDRTRWDQPK